MLDTRIILSGVWVALMLIYLLGDVLRIFSGDVARMGGTQTLHAGHVAGHRRLDADPHPDGGAVAGAAAARQSLGNIIVAVFFFLFNLVGLPTYPSAYDKFLLAVSLGFNVMTVWTAKNWA